jgi:hypothetical protein
MQKVLRSLDMIINLTYQQYISSAPLYIKFTNINSALKSDLEREDYTQQL